MTNPQRNELIETTASERVKNILGGLAMIGLAVFLGMRGNAGGNGWFWVGAVLFGLAGVVWAMASGMKGAACPACGKKHWEITEADLEACLGCGTYLTGDSEAIWLVDANHVAEKPTFALELEESFYWPNSCCACGVEATRTIAVSFSSSQTGRNIALAAAGLAAGALVVRTGGGASGEVNIPHCDAHDDGATFKKEKLLLVRSHAFLRGFNEVNSNKSEV